MNEVEDFVARRKIAALQTRRSCYSESKCAEIAKVSYKTLRDWIRNDPEFADEWALASMQRVDFLEDFYRDKAIEHEDMRAVATFLAVLDPQRWGKINEKNFKQNAASWEEVISKAHQLKSGRI